MTRQEYDKVRLYSYNEYCNYLKEKYGLVPFSYGCIKNREKTDTKGLFIHHIGENEVPSLSNPEIRKEADPKYQKSEMLVYCDYLEHALLHLMIVRETDYHKELGINGLVNYLIPGLIHYYNEGAKHPVWNEMYYERIKNDKEVFGFILNEYNKVIKTLDLTFEFNETLYQLVEDSLNTKNRALAVLGTGLGKTTITLKYLLTHNMKALVIGPNNLIKNSWSEYYEFIDTITYSGFANKYKTINYSNYDIVVLDEAHHAGYDEELGKGATVWGKAIKHLFDIGMKVLGITATPDRTDGIMIGETFFEDCVCEGLAIEDAIEQNIVHPFSYVTALYDTSGITEELKKLGFEYKDDEQFKYLVGQLDLAINNRISVSDIFKKYISKFDNKRKGIVFIQEIEDAEKAISIFSKAFPNTEFRVLHSKLSKEEIKDNRNWFKNTNEGFLVAINMISEGAHYKGVNTIIMFRRTESYVLYTQQIGRIITLTRKENPNAIVFDLVNNINSIKYNDRVKEQVKRKMPEDIRKALMKTQASKSGQIIIADETQDVVQRYKELKGYTERYFLDDEEIKIIKNNYSEIGPKGCCSMIDEWWQKNYPNSLKENEHHRSIQAIMTYASNILHLSYHQKKVLCFNIYPRKLEKKYEKIADAVEELKIIYPNIATSSLCSALKGKTTIAYGKIWCYENLYYKNWEFEQKLPNKYEPIYCYTNNTIYINWKEASEKLNLKIDDIGLCCRGTRKCTKGYQFCFLKDKGTYIFDENLNYGRYYEEKEITFLNQYIPSKGYSWCADKLNRTMPSVKAFVQKYLNVRPNKNEWVNPRSKKIKCTTTNEIFENCKFAAKILNARFPNKRFSENLIRACCCDKRKSHGEMKFEYV